MEQENLPVEPTAQEDVSSGADEFDFSYLETNDDADENTDTSDVEESEDDIEEDDSVDDHQDKKKKGDGFQKRMNDVTAKRRQAEAERDALKAELAEIKRMLESGHKPEVKQEAAKTEATPRPKLEDFDYDNEAFSEALVDWKLEQREIAKETAKAQKAQEEMSNKAQGEVQKLVSDYQKRVENSKYKDFKAVINNLHGLDPIHDDTAQYLMESEVGEHIHYWLGKHPEKWSAISKLPKIKQIAEINKIESAYKSKQNNFKKELSDPISPSKGSSDRVRKTKNLENVEIKSLKDYQRVYRRD